MQSLFDVSGIPNDNQIRNRVDELEPSALNQVFSETLKSERTEEFSWRWTDCDM